MKTAALIIAMSLAALSLPLDAAISGRVVDEDGLPIGGARVQAFARESFEAWYTRALSNSPAAVAVASVETDADGLYSFEIQSPSGVDVVAQAPGKRAGYRIAIEGEEARTLMLRNGQQRRVRVTAEGKPVPGALIADRFFLAYTDKDGFTDLEEPDGGIYESPLVIHPGFAIGRADPPPRESADVLQIALGDGSMIAGSVTEGADNAPVANAVVLVDNLPLTRTVSDGTFVVPFAPPNWRSLAVRSGDRIGVASRSNGILYWIRLRPGSTIRGTVKSGANGNGIVGAAVWIARDGDPTPYRLTLVDATGAFDIEGVPPGSYAVQAGHHAYSASMKRLTIVEGDDVRHDIAMMPLGSISGVVTDEEGAPLASVVVRRASGGQPNVTGSDGRFYLRVPQVAGGVTVTAKRKGCPAVTKRVDLNDGDTIIVIPVRQGGQS